MSKRITLKEILPLIDEDLIVEVYYGDTADASMIHNHPASTIMKIPDYHDHPVESINIYEWNGIGLKIPSKLIILLDIKEE